MFLYVTKQLLFAKIRYLPLDIPLPPINIDKLTWKRINKVMFHFDEKSGRSHCVKSVQIQSFFLSVFSRIRTEYGEILRISLYSVRMRENTDQKKLSIWTHFKQRQNLILFNYKFKTIQWIIKFGIHKFYFAHNKLK